MSHTGTLPEPARAAANDLCKSANGLDRRRDGPWLGRACALGTHSHRPYSGDTPGRNRARVSQWKTPKRKLCRD